MTKDHTSSEQVVSSVSTIKQNFLFQLFCSRMLLRILEPLFLISLFSAWTADSQPGSPALPLSGVPGKLRHEELQELLEMCVHGGLWTAADSCKLHAGEPERVALKPPVKLPYLLTSKQVKEEKNCIFSLRNIYYLFFFSPPQ